MKIAAAIFLSVVFFLVSCAQAPVPGGGTGGGTPSDPAGIYVAMTGNDMNAGTDKTAPVLTLQVAIMKAVSNGLANVYVAEGLYTNGFGLLSFTNSDGSTNSGLYISNNNLNFYGGCDSNSFDPLSNHYSVLSRSGKPDHVVEMRNVTNVSLANFVFTGGYAQTPDPLSMFVGGGMFISNGHYLLVTNCFFTNNRAWHGAGMGLMHSRNNRIYATFATLQECGYGGGIALEAGANENYLHVIISGHVVLYSGGGIWINDAYSNLITGVIANNSGMSGGGGGAAINFGTHNVFSNCVFSGNTTMGDYGGALSISGQQTVIQYCAFSNNRSDIYGGALHIGGANCAVTNSVFINNLVSNDTVNAYGGAIHAAGQNAIVYNCVIANNRTIANGGSIYSYGGGIHATTASGIRIINSLISNNSALYGGGIANLSGGANYLTVDSNIITCNQSSYMGGVFYAGGGSGSRVVNNVITSNSAVVGSGMYMHGWALVQSNLIATNKPVAWGSSLYYSNYPTTNIHNVILGDNTAIGLDYCQMATTIFNSNIIGGSSTNNTGYAFYEQSADTYNHILTYNLFLTNTLSYLYQDYVNSFATNVTVSAWNNINSTGYTGAATAAFNGVTNL